MRTSALKPSRAARRSPAREADGRRGGFILLTVLVVFALAAGVLGATLLIARSAVDGAAVEADALAGELLLDAGVDLAAWQLVGLARDAGDVSGQEIRFDAGTVRVAVAGEAGRVDLNGASPVLLAAAWRAAGRRGLSADAFAARVIDWRDADDEEAERGAETEDYERAEQSPPRNSPFRTPGDLAFVLGVTAADAAALAPFVTVFNPDGKLSARDSPPSLLARLPGMQRQGGEPKIPPALEGTVVAGAGRVFRIRAELVEGKVRRAVEAVVIPGVGDAAPFHVVARWDAPR